MPNADSAPAAFTALVLEAFRLNGLLVAEGDALTADLGLSSARWKVLGAIALEGRNLTVAQIARRMGLTRQAVQRIVNDLRAGGFVDLHDNPDHRRAALVQRTAHGEAAYAQVMARYNAWANALTSGLNPAELARASGVLSELVRRLEARGPR